MKNLSLLYSSFNVIVSLIFPAHANETLNNEQQFQALTTQIIQKSDKELYQEALNYQNNMANRKFLKNFQEESKSLFLPLAEKGHPKSMHKIAFILYNQKDYLSAYKWFWKANEKGLEVSSKKIQLMKKAIKENELTFKSINEKIKLKNFISKMDSKARVGDKNLAIFDILPDEITNNVLDFIPLDQIPLLQAVSKPLYDLILLKFKNIGVVTVRPLDILYFRYLHENAEPLDWKKLAICHDWMERGSKLLNKIDSDQIYEGLTLLKKATQNKYLTAQKKLIRKLTLVVSNQIPQMQEETKKLSLHYLSQLIDILPSISIPFSEKQYLQAKYSLLLNINRKESMETFNQLAMDNHPKALYMMYLSSEKEFYLELSVEAGYVKAQYKLGILMEEKGNIEEAKRLFTLAAEQGYPEASSVANLK